ncbi:MAG TPA: 2-amino-4-hydroxy-6-hydroxymethyldihydropteridine diphosphokinase [Actinomycetes bacterium]
MTRVAVGMGANLGDRLATLQAALAELALSLSEVRVSAVYETAPVGGPEGQPAFLNAVAVGTTTRAASDLLGAMQAIEASHGRVRDVRWGPRTLDLDLLAYGTDVSADPVLTLPHPRAHLRAFVLVPWAEIEPSYALPGLGLVGDLAARLPPGEVEGVRRRADLNLYPGQVPA